MADFDKGPKQDNAPAADLNNTSLDQGLSRDFRTAEFSGAINTEAVKAADSALHSEQYDGVIVARTAPEVDFELGATTEVAAARPAPGRVGYIGGMGDLQSTTITIAAAGIQISRSAPEAQEGPAADDSTISVGEKIVESIFSRPDTMIDEANLVPNSKTFDLSEALTQKNGRKDSTITQSQELATSA